MILGLIPARLSSTRLKKKLLLKIKGKPLIVHTMQRALKSKLLNDLKVCTDDEDIFKTIKNYGGCPIMTSKKFKNGTERIANVAKRIKSKLVIDIQGDEIFVDPSVIDEIIRFHLKNIKIDIVVGCCRTKRLADKSIVKLVFNKNGIVNNMTREDRFCTFDKFNLYKQVDIISFLPQSLERFSSLKKTKNERNNNIELLRALDNGFKIKTLEVKTNSFSINTRSDYLEALKNYKKYAKN